MNGDVSQRLTRCGLFWYMNQKRRIHTLLLQCVTLRDALQLVKRDPYMSKETSPHISRDQFISVKRDVSIHESKHTYNTFLLQYLVLSQQLVINVKRDLYISKEMSLPVLKETYKYTFFACLRSASELPEETSLYYVWLWYVKRDPYMPKETYTGQKRPILVNRDLTRSKETCTGQKRPWQIKRDQHRSKQTYTGQKRPIHVNRDLKRSTETCTGQKRPWQIQRDQHRSQETYTGQKRPLHVNRDLYRSKETSTGQKRPQRVSLWETSPFIKQKLIYKCQKRCRYTSKETYTCQKKPILYMSHTATHCNTRYT